MRGPISEITLSSKRLSVKCLLVKRCQWGKTFAGEMDGISSVSKNGDYRWNDHRWNVYRWNGWLSMKMVISEIIIGEIIIGKLNAPHYQVVSLQFLLKIFIFRVKCNNNFFFFFHNNNKILYRIYDYAFFLINFKLKIIKKRPTISKNFSLLTR